MIYSYFIGRPTVPNDRAIEVRSPAGAKDFSSNLCVQTGSGAHPAFCKMGTAGPFPEAKSGRDVTLTTHPHLVPRSRMSRSCISSPPSATTAWNGTDLHCLLYLDMCKLSIELVREFNKL
jgi:hypothetical protein